MNVRVVVAGALAGLTVFLWTTVSHTALPLGEAGLSPLPDQENLLRTFGGVATGSMKPCAPRSRLFSA